MSSDLWSAFTNDNDNLSHNPWIHPTTPLSSQPVGEVLEDSPQHYNTPKIATNTDLNKSDGKSNWVVSQSSQWNTSSTLIGDPWSISHRDVSGVDHNLDHGNVWSNVQFDKSKISPWTDQGLVDRSHGLPTASVPRNPAPVVQEDGEFGDFEEPELHASGKQARLSEASLAASTTQHLKNSSAADSGTRAAQQQSWGETADVIYDPYHGLESLGKGKEVISPAKHISTPIGRVQSAKYSTYPVQQEATHVPYSADEWGAFSPDPRDDSNPTETQPIVHSRSLSKSTTGKKPVAGNAKASTSSSSTTVPPSNVPPPSILISLVAGLVQKLPTQVENVIKQAPANKTAPKALEKALRNCLASLRVAARILAGRKLRWKRDTHLSQSMSIGLAQGGKAGGMKLTGVDKAETRREDREAAEFIRTWKQNLGNIRSALATVNAQTKGPPLTLPDISEVISIRTAKAEDGGVTAPKSCFLCGLRRDERTLNVDNDVWDTLGEWWSEYWGHIECRAFWGNHEQFLQKRV